MREAASRHRPKYLAVIRYQRALGGTAQAVCFFQYRIKHQCQIAARGIDDLENFGRGGLLCPRLLKVVSLLPKLPLQIVGRRSGLACNWGHFAAPALR
jgi:hypothetical protein